MMHLLARGVDAAVKQARRGVFRPRSLARPGVRARVTDAGLLRAVWSTPLPRKALVMPSYQSGPRGRADVVPDGRVTRILVDAEIEGRCLRLPEQLDRADYVAVDKVLRALGGRWERRRKAHVFDTDPSQAIARVLEGDGVPRSAPAREGFVITPGPLAREVVTAYSGLAPDASARVLEPSAGDGVLVAAVLAHAPASLVVAVEPHPARAEALPRGVSVTAHIDTFEHYAATAAPARFDAVVMNPPFATSDNATVWIDHLHLAWRMLAAGGRLAAILPAGMSFRQDARHRGARELVGAFGGFRDLPADAFAESGTAIRTAVAWMTRPHGRR